MQNMTLAQALRQKKQLVQEYLAVCEDMQTDIRYKPENTEQNQFHALNGKREELRSQIFHLKTVIAEANHESGVLTKIQKFGELKEEVLFWEKLKQSFHRNTVLGIYTGEEAGIVLSAMSRSEVASKISSLNTQLAQLDTEIQKVNHTTFVKV